MTLELWIAIIAQTFVIVGALWTSSIRAERRLTSLETQVKHLQQDKDSSKDGLEKLKTEVQEISKSLARLEGAHTAAHPISLQTKSAKQGTSS